MLLKRDKEHQVAWHRYFALMEVLRAGRKKIDLDELLANGDLARAVKDLVPHPQADKKPSICQGPDIQSTASTKSTTSCQSVSSTMTTRGSEEGIIDEGLVSKATQELSKGVEEPVEKLLQCAILRAFVPTTMPESTTCEEAYRWYLSLPICRVKAVHEQQATQKAKRYAQNLRFEGFKYIKDILPLSKHAHVFTRLGMQEDLMVACKAIIQAIKAPRPAALPVPKVRRSPCLM